MFRFLYDALYAHNPEPAGTLLVLGIIAAGLVAPAVMALCDWRKKSC